MKSKPITEALLACGFNILDHKEHFNDTIPYCDYLYRLRKGKYQYVSVVRYEEEFCEAALEEYRVPKNTRKPKAPVKLEESYAKGYMPERIGIGRTASDILTFVNI